MIETQQRLVLALFAQEQRRLLPRRHDLLDLGHIVLALLVTSLKVAHKVTRRLDVRPRFCRTFQPTNVRVGTRAIKL